MKVTLVSKTEIDKEYLKQLDTPIDFSNNERLIAYIARVSSPDQLKEDYAGLIKYCIKHQHWSIFEQSAMTIEIETSRAISAQILRHRSFSFLEFSQRYAQATEYEQTFARRQDEKNRQNSIDDLNQDTKDWWTDCQKLAWDKNYLLYQEALDKGIAKECARMLLPLSTSTKLYMTGTLRSWIHYLQVRCAPETQKEHRDIANEIKKIFCKEFPVISDALGWIGEVK